MRGSRRGGGCLVGGRIGESRRIHHSRSREEQSVIYSLFTLAAIRAEFVYLSACSTRTYNAQVILFLRSGRAGS